MDGKTHYCSFCGESERDLKALIKGPSALICDACVALCVELLEDKGHWPPVPCGSGVSESNAEEVE
ncbi:TPA: hypothetical protein NI805_004436 [Pseudomonas aeruginosa]|uniref:ClpX C4-type zinc finger protein n=1 Tax=Pseudomonas aeruginosa TaxID=287 RepID=UPI000BB77802|nr:hypothetical protein CJU07_15545 [Pseudomonas aeruginosa]HCF2412850.1 hypothetical protein [Pseudomonas aeruginosa]HCF9839193.1 hypothetical protein [Pseudomonas aeruginosa]